MAHGGPPRQLAPANSNVVYVTGVVDVLDAKDAEGNPKWIDTATVTWEVRTAEGGGGVQVANGSAIPLGGGQYACLLSPAVAILADHVDDYIFRTIILLPGQTVPDVDIDTPFRATRRTGETPYT
jgi:hypothetical protein